MRENKGKDTTNNKSFTVSTIIFIVCCILFTYGEIAGGTFQIMRIIHAIIIPAFAVSGIPFGWRTINESKPDMGFWVKITIAIFGGWLFLGKALIDKVINR